MGEWLAIRRIASADSAINIPMYSPSSAQLIQWGQLYPIAIPFTSANEPTITLRFIDAPRPPLGNKKKQKYCTLTKEALAAPDAGSLILCPQMSLVQLTACLRYRLVVETGLAWSGFSMLCFTTNRWRYMLRALRQSRDGKSSGGEAMMTLDRRLHHDALSGSRVNLNLMHTWVVFRRSNVHINSEAKREDWILDSTVDYCNCKIKKRLDNG